MVENQPLAVAFGVFDRLHDGHLDFLRQVHERFGENNAVIVVTRDNMVQRFKKRMPHQSETARAFELVRRGFRVTFGDREPGGYEILHTLKPTVICLGYDQHALQQHLSAYLQTQPSLSHIQLVTMTTSNPDLHTSTLYPTKT